MNTLANTASLLTHSLAWALLYSLWQGALIYGSLYLLLKALPNVNARAKYYLSFSALAATFLWFADTWSTQYQKLKGVTVFITQSAPDGGFTKTFSINTIAGAPIHDTAIHQLLPRLEQYFPFILMLYAAGLAFMLCRFTVNILQLRALRIDGIVAPGEEWGKLLQYWQNKMEITRPVKLYLSNRINTPMMLGVLKPIILLPVAAINHLSTDQVEAILMHELAHIKRHDYLLNIFQVTAETILFFNPFVWLISAVTRREREHCCDDVVVACAASPLPYARALAILESSRMSNGLVLAATGRKNQLFHRIKRIMEMKKSNVNYGQLTIIVVAILAITFSIAMFTFTPSFAQKAKGDTGDTATKTKSVYKYKSITIDSNGKKTEVVKESDKPIKEMRDEDDNVDMTIMNDDSDGTPTGKKAKTYSYSFSSSDSDGFEDLASNICALALHIHGGFTDAENLAELKKIGDIDWNKVSDEIKNSLKEINVAINEETKMDKKVSDFSKDMLEDFKKALEDDEKKLSKIQSKQVKVEARTRNGSAVAIAKSGDEDATTENTDYEAMLTKMEQDKLIDRSQVYKVAKKNGTLYINGEKQPESVFNKYSQYLKDKSLSIKGHKGSLSISVDN